MSSERGLETKVNLQHIYIYIYIYILTCWFCYDYLLPFYDFLMVDYLFVSFITK